MSQRTLWPLVAVGVLLVACSGDQPVRGTATPSVSPIEATTAAPQTAGSDLPSPSPSTPAPSPAPAVLAVTAPPTPNTSAAIFAAPLDLSRVVVPPGNGALVVVDPGHGGDEVGAAAASGVVERDSNLEMAQRVERLLTQAGYRVLLTRRDGGRAVEGLDGSDQPRGFSAQRRDLQARIDIANAANAAVFVSLHSNGLNDPSANGVETYYNSARPFSAQSRLLAQSIQGNVVAEMARSGYRVRDRGALDDACLRAFQGVCFPLFVLGPPRVTTRDEVTRRGGDPATLGFLPGQDAIASRGTQMPGALTELLFVSNPDDARLLSDGAAREALARGVVLGISRFLSEQPR